jgi:peptidoglycan/xylan/chitin deacetylase (PgdA/CDA1 family)
VASAYTNELLDVVPEQFDAHLRALQHEGWRTISPDGLADALERDRQLPPRTFVITLDDGHDDGLTYALPILQRYGFVATYYLVTSLLEQPTYLSWAQVRALQGLGMEIGNHTIDHLALTTLAAREVLRQVAGAQAIFEANLTVPPTTFSYPYGLWDPMAIQAVRATGLRCAMTSTGGLEESWSGRFTLPRINVRNGWTPAQLIKSVNRFL